MIKIERRLHQGWIEFDRLPEKIKQKLPSSKGYFGKYQNIYTQGDKKISLIRVKGYRGFVWEIYSFETKDVLEFKTKKEAVRKIMRLLK